MWAGKAGAFSIVAAGGEAAPGTGGTFSDFGGLSINAAGNVAFSADLTGAERQLGYYAVDGGGLVQAIPEAASFPDVTNFTLAAGGTTEYAAGNFLAVKLELEGPDNGRTSVLATGRPGNLRATFAEGRPAPTRAGLPGNLVFERIFGDGTDSFGDPGAFVGFNDDQEIIFVADVSANAGDFNRTVVYAGPSTSPRVVAVSQETAPGSGGAVYERFGQPSLSSNGLIAFSAQTSLVSPDLNFKSVNAVTGANVADGGDAIFLGRPSGVEPIVRSGELVPGGGTGIVFGSFESVAVNARGDVVFSGEILYPNAQRRPSLWLKRAGEKPVLLAATGTVFETADGLAEVTGLRFQGAGGVNDLNQVAFVLSFGGRDGFYVADVRSGYPVLRITSPARRADQVTTRANTVIAGTAVDATGVRRVDVEVTARAATRQGPDGEKRRGRRKRVQRALTVTADGTWSFRAPLRQGRNRVSVTATDVLGNVSPSTDFTVIRYSRTTGTKDRKVFQKLKRRVVVAR